MIAFAVYFSACQKTGVVNPSNPSGSIPPDVNQSQNSLVFPHQAHMYGKSYPEWAAEWWKWNLHFDCDHVPLRDIDGSRENQNQSGSVFFLAGRRGHTLNVTVFADVSLFFPLISFETEYPCSDNGEPNPGETVEHFLTRLTQVSTDAMDQLSLTIDGVPIGNIADYKFISPMFNIAANSDLANCFDGCISGTSQPFVAGGYFFMLKPLSAGPHVIRRIGGASSLFPFVYDITYNITQL
jgi:hypothetical protein